MKKKRKLRKWVNVTLFVVLIIIISLLLILMSQNGNTQFNQSANECDDFYGRTCTYYEVRQFSINQ